MTTSSRSRWWIPWALLCVPLLAGAFWFDGDVHAWMMEHQTPAMRSAMRAVSWWGDWPSHVVLGLLGAGIAYASGNRRWLAIFLAMVLACAVAGSVNRVIKVVAGRARPNVELDAGWNGPRLSSKYHAFPSGHTAASVGFFTTLMFARRRVGVALLPIPLLIAFSRLYVGAHHLSDVIFAAILATFCGFLVWRLVERKFPTARLASD